MTNGITRITAAAVLVVQWIGVVAIILLRRFTSDMFSQYTSEFPVVFRISAPSVLITLSVATTIGIIISEVRMSEPQRFMIQIVDLCFWMLLTVYTLLSFFGPAHIVE